MQHLVSIMFLCDESIIILMFCIAFIGCFSCNKSINRHSFIIKQACGNNDLPWHNVEIHHNNNHFMASHSLYGFLAYKYLI